MPTAAPNPRAKKRAFTLVEIILAILVAGVVAVHLVPRSRDTGQNALAASLQTLRSQIELFKIQHNDNPPVLTGGTTATANWAIMLGRSEPLNLGPAPATTGTLGPYLQQPPVNGCNNQSAVGTTFSTTVGWVYTVSGANYIFSAVNTSGTGLLTY